MSSQTCNMNTEIVAAIAADRERVAQALDARAVWEHCDCGCPNERAPRAGRDIGFIFAAAQVRSHPIEVGDAVDRNLLIEAAKNLLKAAEVTEWMIDRRPRRENH
jgi:hypothetical protein